MRRLVVLCGLMIAVALVNTGAPAFAQGSRILSVTKPLGDPGLIDVTVTEVQYDAAAGAITVTGTVVCNAEPVSVFVIDYSASQTRGGATTVGSSFTESNPCGGTFSGVIEADSGGGFQRGRATLEVAASACGAGCTLEVVRVEVVLIAT